MSFVLMMQMTIDKVVHMVAMRYCRMPRSRDHECGRLHAHYRHVHRCIGRDWLRLRPMNALRRRQQTSDGANAHREENRYGLRA